MERCIEYRSTAQDQIECLRNLKKKFSDDALYTNIRFELHQGLSARYKNATALHWAAAHGRLDLVKFFLAEGCNPRIKAKREDGITAAEVVDNAFVCSSPQNHCKEVREMLFVAKWKVRDNKN